MSKVDFRSRLGAVAATVLLCSCVTTGVAIAAPGASASDGASSATEKIETVTATTNAVGDVEGIEVDVTLKNAEGALELTDYSDLTGIDAHDDVRFEASGGNLIWRADGSDVSYTGVTGKDLPISIEVTYSLDGKPVSPSELAGKSGKVVIRYDYRNASVEPALVNGKAQQVSTPFTCITALLIDGKRFSNIEVRNGRVIDDGDDVIVAGYAMPGLKESLGPMAEDHDIPDYFELSADVQDFELSQAMTIATTGLLSDFDTKRLGFGDMDEAAGSLDDAMGQLVEGAGQLSEGMDALSAGTGQLNEGTSALASGAESLQDALYAFAYGSSGNPGLPGAYAGASDVLAAMDAFGASLDQIADVNNGLPAAAAGLEAAAQALPSAEQAQALQAAVAASDLAEEDKQALYAVLEGSAHVAGIAPAVSQSSQALIAMNASYADLVTGAESLTAGMAQAVEAARQLYDGAKGMSDGANRLSQATAQLKDGADAAAMGTDALEDGMGTFKAEGIDKLVELVDVDLGGLRDRLSALSEASDSYDNFSGKEDGVQSSVRFVFETAAIEAESE